MGGWTDRGMDGQRDGRTDGWMDRSVNPMKIALWGIRIRPLLPPPSPPRASGGPWLPAEAFGLSSFSSSSSSRCALQALLSPADWSAVRAAPAAPAALGKLRQRGE